MSFISQFIHNQYKSILANYWHALMCAVVLILTPYTTWLSLAVIGLVTLRRGWKDGGLLLLPVLIAHIALSLMSLTFWPAIINTALIFLPCFIAAVVLRYTTSWQMVAGVFLVEMMIAAFCLQIMMPDFITAQYVYLKDALSTLHANSALMSYINNEQAFNQTMIANYLLGLQMMAVMMSSVMSLMMSRFIQAKLYYPEGFKQEMLSFRGHKIALFLLAICLLMASQKNVLAMNLLPAMVIYFLFAGLSLSLQLLAKKKLFGLFVILITPLIFLPFITLPVYVILGALDSLINFRLYLPYRAGKTT